jgi:hypothetical protein
VYGAYTLAQLKAALPMLTGRLYNDGGALKLPVCMIGIDNGTNKGIVDTDAIETIDLSACSNSNWLAIEMSVAGTTYTLMAADIAGATDPTIIPASVRIAWDAAKGAYYLTATKRLIGLAWKNAAGVLLAVVNFDGQKIWASQIGLHTGTIHEQYGPGLGISLAVGTWNMDTTPALQIFYSLGVFSYAVNEASVFLNNTAGSTWRPLNMFVDAADPRLMSGGISYVLADNIRLERRTGGDFDGATYNAATGTITLKFREF